MSLLSGGNLSVLCLMNFYNIARSYNVKNSADDIIGLLANEQQGFHFEFTQCHCDLLLQAYWHFAFLCHIVYSLCLWTLFVAGPEGTFTQAHCQAIARFEHYGLPMIERRRVFTVLSLRRSTMSCRTRFTQIVHYLPAQSFHSQTSSPST
jgi:hypothetical protein